MKTLCRQSLRIFMFLLLISGLALFGSELAMAAAGGTGSATSGVGSIAQRITGNLGPFANLITAGAYIAGFGFVLASIFKFKSHKDNPTQIPIGTPIALLFIGVAMVFLPSVIGTTGKTLFKSGSTGGVSGVSTVPGANK